MVAFAFTRSLLSNTIRDHTLTEHGKEHSNHNNPVLQKENQSIKGENRGFFYLNQTTLSRNNELSYFFECKIF